MKEFLKRWIGAIVDWRRVVSLGYLPRYAADWIVRSAVKPDRGRSRAADKLSMPGGPLADHAVRSPLLLPGQLAGAAAGGVQTDANSVDIGSSVLTMGGASAHVPTIFVDYRPLLSFIKAG